MRKLIITIENRRMTDFSKGMEQCFDVFDANTNVLSLNNLFSLSSQNITRIKKVNKLALGLNDNPTQADLEKYFIHVYDYSYQPKTKVIIGFKVRVKTAINEIIEMSFVTNDGSPIPESDLKKLKADHPTLIEMICANIPEMILLRFPLRKWNEKTNRFEAVIKFNPEKKIDEPQIVYVTYTPEQAKVMGAGSYGAVVSVGGGYVVKISNQLIENNIESYANVYCVVTGYINSSPHYFELQEAGHLSLKSYLRDNSKLTRKDRFHLAIQFLSRLKRLHANNVCHGDIKPENVVVRHKLDGTIDLLLVDFGMSTMVEHKEAGSPRVRGTPLYMSNVHEFRKQSALENDLVATLRSLKYSLSLHEQLGQAQLQKINEERKALGKSLKKKIINHPIPLSIFQDEINDNPMLCALFETGALPKDLYNMDILFFAVLLSSDINIESLSGELAYEYFGTAEVFALTELSRLKNEFDAAMPSDKFVKVYQFYLYTLFFGGLRQLDFSRDIKQNDFHLMNQIAKETIALFDAIDLEELKELIERLSNPTQLVRSLITQNPNTSVSTFVNNQFDTPTTNQVTLLNEKSLNPQSPGSPGERNRRGSGIFFSPSGLSSAAAPQEPSPDEAYSAAQASGNLNVSNPLMTFY